jgi:HAD domain in Swiss Army Knife RNA repair proteins
VKVVFVDADGCLNSVQTFAAHKGLRMDVLDPVLMSNLAILMKGIPEFKIVISSTWRKSEDFRGTLMKGLAKVKLDHLVIGDTPSLDGKERYLHLTKYPGLTKRGLEIRAYLEDHPVNDLVIIDDNRVLEPDLNPDDPECEMEPVTRMMGLSHVHTDPELGFCWKDLSFLSRKYNFKLPLILL